MIRPITARDGDNADAWRNEFTTKPHNIRVHGKGGRVLRRVIFTQRHGIDRELAAAVAVSTVCGASLGNKAMAAKRKDQIGALRVDIDGNDRLQRRQAVTEGDADTHPINVRRGWLARHQANAKRPEQS